MARLLAAAGFTLLVGAGACTSNHDLLATQPSSGGSGGALPDAAPDAQGGGGGVPDAAPDVTEPTGPDRLTLLHGVVDATRIAFCFARVDSGGASLPVGSPLPAQGLDFAHATSVPSLQGLDFAKDAIQPIVIAGDLSLVSGKTCDAAIALAQQMSAPDAGPDAAVQDAGADAAPSDAAADASTDAKGDAPSDAAVDAPPPAPPPLRAQALPVLPAGTLTGGRSYLLVAAGCMGAPGFSDSLDQAVCGDGYAPDRPTLTPVVVRMSRITAAERLGLQAVNASRATDNLTVQSGTPPNTTENALRVASELGFGAILPRPPDLDHALVDYGTPIGTVPLEGLSGSTSALSQTWSDALARGGVSKLENGQTYAIIVVGPRIDIATPGWWNLPAISVVPTAP